MISETASEQPCKTCGGNKGKLQKIIEGWKNYIFPDAEVEKIAKFRALKCATCDFNILEMCTKCNCPIPMKTRSMDSECEINRWNEL